MQPLTHIKSNPYWDQIKEVWDADHINDLYNDKKRCEELNMSLIFTERSGYFNETIDLLDKAIEWEVLKYETAYDKFFVSREGHIARTSKFFANEGQGSGNQDKFDPFA